MLRRYKLSSREILRTTTPFFSKSSVMLKIGDAEDETSEELLGGAEFEPAIDHEHGRMTKTLFKPELKILHVMTSSPRDTK